VDPATILGKQNPSVEEQASLADLIVEEVLNQRPDPNDPRYKERNADGYAVYNYTDEVTLWLEAVQQAATASASLKEFTQGRITMPDGTIRLLGTATPEELAVFEEANRQVYRNLLNQYGLDQYQVDKDRAQTDFQNKLDALDASLALDETRLDQATKKIDRQLAGQQESRQRAQLVSDTKRLAAPYATTAGKTSFSASDLGGSLLALAGQAGVDGRQSLLNYPALVTLDPEGDLSRFDAQGGVSGPLPGIPDLLTAGGAPGAPQLPGAPRLLAPEAPSSLLQLAGQSGAPSPVPDAGASLLQLAAQSLAGGTRSLLDMFGGAVGSDGTAAQGGTPWQTKALVGAGQGINAVRNPPAMSLAQYLGGLIR